MKRASFWLFVIGSAALFAYLFDLVFLSRSNLPGPLKAPVAQAPGRPIFLPTQFPAPKTKNSRNYTNEEIYQNLQKQTVKMGIEDIVSPKDKNSQNSSLPPWLRKEDEGVYLEGGTPALLKNEKPKKAGESNGE
jgi:hypothetical protein